MKPHFPHPGYADTQPLRLWDYGSYRDGWVTPPARKAPRRSWWHRLMLRRPR